ncbi:hypothetical protein ABKN59_011517, partial [Abortiporus biennis]
MVLSTEHVLALILKRYGFFDNHFKERTPQNVARQASDKSTSWTKVILDMTMPNRRQKAVGILDPTRNSPVSERAIQKTRYFTVRGPEAYSFDRVSRVARFRGKKAAPILLIIYTRCTISWQGNVENLQSAIYPQGEGAMTKEDPSILRVPNITL